MNEGKTVTVPIDGTSTKVILVDGEKEFNQPGKSAGFIHFKCPWTGKCLGFAGANWMKENGYV